MDFLYLGISTVHLYSEQRIAGPQDSQTCTDQNSKWLKQIDHDSFATFLVETKTLLLFLLKVHPGGNWCCMAARLNASL